MLQPAEKRLWRKQFAACRCQFNGQRQAVQANTDLSNETSVSRGHLEVWHKHPCALEKERNGSVLRERLYCGKLFEAGHGKRWNEKLVLSTDVQWSTTRHQDFKARANS